MSLTRLISRKIANYHSPRSFGSKLRAKRIILLLNMIEEVYKEQGLVNIVDIGGTGYYWNIVPDQFLEEHNVTITIVNLPDAKELESRGRFSFVIGDGCNLTDFADNSFHIAHSNSVIEHVGDWEKMVAFSNEIKRVAPKYFVQTPNYWFPIEPHCMTPFFHWLPKPVRIWLVMKFSLGYWGKADSVDDAVRIVESCRLLNKKMFCELFGDALVYTEKLMFMPKSFMGIRG